MNLFKSNRLAWSVAAASLALWATTAPVSWGQVATGTARLFDQAADDSANTTIDTMQLGDTTSVITESGSQSLPCPPLPPAIAELIPSPPTSPAAPAASAPAAQSGSFHICGADPQAERAIEQLIGGRSFRATLSARGDGCADLNIQVGQQASNGTSSTNLKVSVGSGRNLLIQLVSDQGATHASISGQ